ncbi:MAG: hypothetical protein ACOC06_07980 [Halorubrum sp.]
MTDDLFTDPEDTSDGWVDVRMTDPEKGEWDIDLVVVDGQVDYVDVRIRPDLLDAFVDCLVGDLSDDRASALLAGLAERNDIDLAARSGDD